MKILMVCKGEYYNLMPLVAETLKRLYHYDVTAVTFASTTAALPQMCVFDQVHDVSTWLRHELPRHSVQECIAYLRTFEQLDETPNINMMIRADRIMSEFRYERAVKAAAAVCRFWERIFDEARPDVVIGEVASASEWIGWSLAQRSAIDYFIPYPSPIPGHFNLIYGPQGCWEIARNLYESARNRTLQTDEARVADDFLVRFRTTGLRSPIHAAAVRSPFGVDRVSIRRLMNRVARIPHRVRTYRNDGEFELGSYNGKVPWQGVQRDITRTIRHAIARRTMFTNEVGSDPYVYFPLHVQPEFTIDVRAPFASNQLALIESIAKSVPVGHSVIVKEHPAMRGRRKLAYYQEIKRLHNVRLVSPTLDSHTIIKGADAVLTVAGTAAWEAILYERPVIAFGPLCYRFFDLVSSCTSICELPDALNQAIRAPRRNRSLLQKFIWATLAGSHKGIWCDPVAMPNIRHPKNIDDIAHAIESEITWKRGPDAWCSTNLRCNAVREHVC